MPQHTPAKRRKIKKQGKKSKLGTKKSNLAPPFEKKGK